MNRILGIQPERRDRLVDLGSQRSIADDHEPHVGVLAGKLRACLRANDPPVLHANDPLRVVD